MRFAEVRRTKEDLLLLAVSVTAAAAAIVSVREATPPHPGLWVATAVALALALACVFAVWFGGAARRRLSHSLHGEWDAARTLLSALPDGLMVVRDGRIRSVNRGLCDLLGFDRQELLGEEAPFPFWPPEHRHEIESWHAELEARGELVAELTFCHRRGDRIRVLVAGRAVDDGSGASRHLVTVRDVSASHRRERRLTELSARDEETGLLDRREFEARLAHAVRLAKKTDTNLTVVLAQVSLHGRAGEGVLARPEALLAVDRLGRILRAGDDVARTDASELGWILPETDAAGGIEAVTRWRSAIADVDGVSLTAGVADLAGAGDALSLYALADRALADARRSGDGATVPYEPPAQPAPGPSKRV
jgi:PAS domain S-box-containing protein